MRTAFVASLVALSLGFSAVAVPPQKDFAAELERAKSLYYSADFQEAVDLLIALNSALRTESDRKDELRDATVFLALSYLGLGRQDEARSIFVEVCTLDPGYTLEPDDFSPAVLALFNRAKASCNEARLSRANELYRREQFAEASKIFFALQDDEDVGAFAREYLRLTRQRIQLHVEAGLLDWQKNIESRQFEKAAALYEKMNTASPDPLSREVAVQVESEYEKLLSRLVAAWKAACNTANRKKMDEVREEAMDLTAGLDLGKNALLQMEHCQSRQCISGDPVLAMTRLRTRVNPKIDRVQARYLSNARADITIDEDGTVQVNKISNTNPQMAEELTQALKQWRFYPVVIEDIQRCIETRLPIDLILP